MIRKKVEVVIMKHPRLDALDKETVVKTAKNLQPGTIQKWSAMAEGKEFPVKQLVRESANLLPMDAPRVTPADFIAHDAVRILKRLGFEVRYSE
jgi:hypothetical protein